jgi:hypothetical protein
MDHMVTTRVRVGAIALLALVLAFCGEHAAEASERIASPSGQPAARSQRLGAPSVSEQQNKLGTMRYYGGPKSPAWRGPSMN